MRRAAASVWAACAVFAWASAARADETPIPAAPRHFVTDEAGVLSASTRTSLDQRLEAYERATGRQVLVWIGVTLGDASIEDWSARAFQAWRVGRQGVDDGLAVFVFARDRKVRIEVGYGLEGVITDAQAARTIREVIGPRMAAGDPDGAMVGAADRLLGLLGGEVNAPPRRVETREPAGARGNTLGKKIAGAVLALVFIVLFITNPRLAMLLLISLASGGRGRGGFGGGGGGGGFGGGGGRSGGGGASGSW
jgi:uncharacterized protein